MTPEKYYAHTPNEDGDWHTLNSHSLAVAKRAKEFAEKFDAGNLAYLIGLWHDVGKANPKFFDYLINCYEGKKAKGPHHAIWGAVVASNLDFWEEVALPIAGHHAGLHQRGYISQKIETIKVKTTTEEHDLFSCIIDYLNQLPLLTISTIPLPNFNHNQKEFFIRMLFSTLVDADYLNTEKHFKRRDYEARKELPSIGNLWTPFHKNQQALILKSKKKDKKINIIRNQIYDFCIKAASQPPGIFQLTVPTGGGKTRSGLGFALNHAKEWGMERIIFAIPYTSIIDQTAQEYRRIFGQAAVLEHHSQVVLAENSEDNYNSEQIAKRLAIENWDAPIVVTTTVQLFESIFSNKPSKCRKLHNLSKSIIVLDEVQALPPELLTPILDVLRTLADHYGTTIVMCTATQPSFEKGNYDNPFQSLPIKKIIPEKESFQFFDDLKRVEYEIRREPDTWEEIADEISDLSQVLVVVNSRKDALSLLNILKARHPRKRQNLFHLSTLLCGAHRKIILRKIKKLLNAKQQQPVTLISTQVIEAGVDIDFPVVYRSIGPLDRIVQAAGRCNRENNLSCGKVIVFEPAKGGVPKGPYKAGLEKAKLLLKDIDASKLHDPTFYELYFDRLLSEVNMDDKKIQTFRSVLDYPKVAKTFKMIDQDTWPLVINCSTAEKRLDEWQKNPSRRTWQRLQPLIVNIFANEGRRLCAEGWIEKITDNLYLSRGKYDDLVGIIHEITDPCDLIF